MLHAEMNADEASRSSSLARRHAARMLTAVLLGTAVACVSHWSPPPEAGYHRTGAVAGAGARIGAEACTDCHDSFDEHFMASEVHGDCEACHGPAERHAYTAAASDISYPSNDVCASCHQIGSKTLLGWSTSVHERSSVLCSDCHDTHGREPRLLRKARTEERAVLPHASAETRMCAGCHPGVVAQLGLPSHHPVGEGMLDCTDCHDPHGNRSLTRGPRTQVCTECHQEVMGPWIYEHAPVNEDCGYCHTPHGATADFLLETTQPAACISCHTIPTSGAIHDPYAFTTRCTDCHNAVHGSFTDPVLRR
jgi:DmsE family decaheme c-type cytochrome